MDEEHSTPAVESTDSARARDADERSGFGSLGSIVFLLALTWAAGIASFPLNDNSFFTHLATGRIILDEGSVPSTDPYTFTATGEPWTVQSWLASVAYAGAEQLAGGGGLRLLVLAIFLVAMAVLWRLTRPAESIVVRLLVVTASLFVVTDLWSERPYMAGVIGLGVVWLAMEGAVRPWLVVPLLWVWGNTHGSFPLAVVLAGSIALGSWLDRRRERGTTASQGRSREAETHRRVLTAIVAGTLAAAIGPLGLDVLRFPFAALSKSDVLVEIVEWQAPTFRSLSERAFLILALTTVVLLTRRGSWRLTIPSVLFLGAALTAQRNVVLATVVLVAVASRSAPPVGTLRSRTRPVVGTALASSLVGLFALVSVVALRSPVTGFGGYPARGLAWLGQGGPVAPDAHLATQDFTGNLIEALDGPSGAVFIDDRVDMFPEDVFHDSLELSRGETSWEQVLDDYDIELVLWARSEPTASLVAADGEWQIIYSDTEWAIACRRASACRSATPP